jgi:hypothetical protein
MSYKSSGLFRAPILFLTLAGAMLSLATNAASCKTQSQMTLTERDAISNAARGMIGNVQSGDVQALRAKTISAVAAEFNGIADSVSMLAPIVQLATITVDNLYELDASAEPPGVASTAFYCGTPLVVLNFTNLPTGNYALVIIHATGVPRPQQISLILS